MKVAKLVEVSLLVRIIVDENATEDQIIAATYPKLQDKLNNREVGDNVVSIEEDEEVPFGEAPSDITGETPFEVVQTRIHIGDDDFCSSCGAKVTGEQHSCDKSEEVYQQIKHEYVKSDVCSGEFYVYVKISVDYTESEVRKGIQKFLDWDESPAKFDLKKNKKYWKIIDK